MERAWAHLAARRLVLYRLLALSASVPKPVHAKVSEVTEAVHLRFNCQHKPVHKSRWVLRHFSPVLHRLAPHLSRVLVFVLAKKLRLAVPGQKALLPEEADP